MATLPAPSSLPRRWYAPFAVLLFGVLLAGAALVVPSRATAAPAATRLDGTLQLTPGSCAGGKATGTYFRMILPSGGQNGPYMSNGDSACSDQSFTLLRPGSDGGLRIGAYQPAPSPRFTSSGDARASRITAPARFYGTAFATATTRTDPQTKRAVPAPTVTVSGSTLSADLRSIGVTWNNQDFNQGAPKPDGSLPGNTRRATGTFDARTGAFTLDWTSQIVGGPFDKFTGAWHFEGRFVPAAGSPGGSTSGGTTGATTGGSTGGTSGTTGGAATPGSAVTPVVPGVPAVPGAAPSAKPGSVPAALAGEPVTQAAATTEVVTKDRWHVRWPVIGLAIGLGLLAVGGLVLSSVLGRRPGSES